MARPTPAELDARMRAAVVAAHPVTAAEAFTVDGVAIDDVDWCPPPPPASRPAPPPPPAPDRP